MNGLERSKIIGSSEDSENDENSVSNAPLARLSTPARYVCERIDDICVIVHAHISAAYITSRKERCCAVLSVWQCD